MVRILYLSKWKKPFYRLGFRGINRLTVFVVLLSSQALVKFQNVRNTEHPSPTLSGHAVTRCWRSFVSLGCVCGGISFFPNASKASLCLLKLFYSLKYVKVENDNSFNPRWQLFFPIFLSIRFSLWQTCLLIISALMIDCFLIGDTQTTNVRSLLMLVHDGRGRSNRKQWLIDRFVVLSIFEQQKFYPRTPNEGKGKKFLLIMLNYGSH